MGHPQSVGTLSEARKFELCKCGHIHGVHRYKIDCTAAGCGCKVFSLAEKRIPPSGFDPKPVGGSYYGRSDQ